jgi:hypothetical protein
MKMVKDARSRLKDFSTIALALSAAIVGVWATFPADWLKFLPTEWVAKGTGVLSLWGLIGKFIVQGSPPDDHA